ncbi:MAG: prolipoprotein diacylglyceryl transferase [Dysgonamonadaceae bacterium]|jgi:prolipoprotein diacylglyceryl transferase|nr:prolipoprotein diacylglyceryl transferase [Dysgonamonadaceae bacterium]
MLLSFITWTADPVAFTIPFFEREIRWYGIAFALGFWLGWWMVSKIWKNENLKTEWIDKLFLYVILATAIGARLGHCFFYDPDRYLSNPLEILKIWEGGLASHGGTLGIIIAIWIYSKRVTHTSMLWTFDRLVVPVGFVAALIRFGNLMNSEIFGHATTLPWGFCFVKSKEWQDLFMGQPCHPTQLYEAFFYILASLICLWMYWKRKDYKYQGLIFGVFMICIFLPRFFIEFLKNNQESFEEGMILNMGQLLSIPFIIAGIWFTYKGIQERNKSLKKR